ncbi:hypothetical protein YC2023_066807 [Brassica napus]
MEKRQGERSGGCSESRLLGLIARRIYFTLQIYGGALMAATREFLKSFLFLKPSRSKSGEAFLEGVEPRSSVRRRVQDLLEFVSLSLAPPVHGVLHFTLCRKTRRSCQPEEWSFGNHMVESQYPRAGVGFRSNWWLCSTL